MEQNESEATGFSETEYEKLKFLYEKAIEGRNVHLQSFNHWMNMYAIFNGALFVALYNFKEIEFRLLVSFLGCVAGIFWHLSSHGFYDWIISWINVVTFYEKRLTKNPVYGMFVQPETKIKSPISTQKVTMLFSIIVAITWGIALLVFSIKCGKLALGVFILAITLTALAFRFFPDCWKETNLKDTHIIIHKDKYGFAILSKPTTEEKN